MRPIHDPLDPPVADWIVMNIVNVGGQIPLVTDHVFPKPSLPDSPFMLPDPALALPLLCVNGSREAALDEAPAGGKISLTLGQGPDAVKMVRQDDHRLDPERTPASYCPKRFP